MYKTIVFGFVSSKEARAKLIEDKANEMYMQGWELVTVSSTPNAGAIMVFKQRFFTIL